LNTQKRTRGMVEASLMTALTCLFAIVGTYIPLLAFVLLFIPIPLIVLGKRHGIHFVVLSIIASAIIIGSLTEPVYSIFVVALPGITAIVMGYLMNKDYPPGKVLAGGAVAALISSLLSISLTALISGVGSIKSISEMFKEISEMQLSMSRTLGMGDQELEKMRTTLESTMEIATMIIPSEIMMSSVFLAYINYVLTIQVLKRIGYKVEPLKPFKEFSLPKSILMGTSIIAVLSIFMKYVPGIDYNTLVANVFVVFQFIYLLQGLAVVIYFMAKINLGKALRTVLIVFLFFNQMGLFIIAVVGFIDIIVNFRKINISR